MARFPALCRHLTVGAFLAVLALSAAIWSTPATAQPPPDLSAALLTVDDLPAGWTAVNVAGFELDLDDLSADEPFDPAAVGLDPNGECAAALAPLTAVLSEQPPAFELAAFQRGEIGPFIAQVVISLPLGLADSLVDPNTADFEALSDACQEELEDEEEVEEIFDDLGDLDNLGISFESTPLKVSQIGDESVATRTDISVGFLGTSLLSVFSRRGEAVSLLFMLADPITATESVGLIEQLAGRIDARLTEVLAGR